MNDKKGGTLISTDECIQEWKYSCFSQLVWLSVYICIVFVYSAAAMLLLGVNVVFKLGVHDPKNKDKDLFDLAMEEMKYAADKLGVSREEPPSN